MSRVSAQKRSLVMDTVSARQQRNAHDLTFPAVPAQRVGKVGNHFPPILVRPTTAQFASAHTEKQQSVCERLGMSAFERRLL